MNEEDESIEDVTRAFENGEPLVTRAPRRGWNENLSLPATTTSANAVSHMWQSLTGGGLATSH